MLMFDYSVVLPCLNEEKTLGSCILEAQEAAQLSNLLVEIIVADNGSTDNSVEIAESMNARVVHVGIKGYGAALDAGIRAALADVVVVGDSDMSYDFRDAPEMYLAIKKSHADLVIGNRFKGGIAKGAMPFHHKYFGNPILSFLGRKFFRIPIGDFHCGLRALRKEKYLQANPVTTGMEYATEMIARFANIDCKIVEIPTQLRKDGRDRPPHLRSFPDGWRHLKMMLLYSPQYFQLLPGILASILGFFGLAMFVTTGKIDLLFATGDLQTSIFALVAYIVGLQLISASFITLAYAKSKGIKRFSTWPRIEKVVISKHFALLGVILILIGFGGIIIFGSYWLSSGFPSIDPLRGTRMSFGFVSLLILGTQILLCSIQVRQLLSKFW